MGSGYEVALAGATERLTQEIQCGMLAAARFPRSEEQARQNIMRLCERQDFAEKARYKYSRGQTEITGASVVMARELARNWGHVRTGFTIIADTPESRTIQAYAWDMQTNEHMVQEDTFKKVQQRKGDSGRTDWVSTDERDLAELTRNKAGRIIRNCIIHILPWDLVADALDKVKGVCVAEVKRDPDAAKRSVIDGFSKINVPIKEVEQYVGHSLGSCSPEELDHLRSVWTAIHSGEETWRDFYNPEPTKDTVTLDKNTASVFEGATGKTVERPTGRTEPQGADDATRPFLPKELRQSDADERPESEHLLDVVGAGTKDAVEAVLLYVSNSKHLPAADRLGLMRACMARAADFATATETGGLMQEDGEGQSEEVPSGGESKEEQEKPKPIPHQVMAAIIEMKTRSKSGTMAVHMAYKVRWDKVVANDPKLSEWTPRVEQEREKIIAEITGK